MCREAEDGVTTYGEDDAGNWTRTGVMLPGLSSILFRDDDTICGISAQKTPTIVDRSDVLFFEAKPCWAPPAVAGGWEKIRMFPAGTGAIFTYPPTGRSASGNTEFFGFDAKGESLADASNAWFGDRTDERLLEHDTTNSAGERSYDLAGVPFDPALAFGEGGSAPVQIDQAFFVDSPEASLIIEVSYQAGSPATRSSAVARWSVRGKRFCGSPVAGRITSIAPTGDAVAIDGRIYKVGLCASDHGFEPGDVTDALAVGPGATRWISAEGDTLKLHGPDSAVTDFPSAEKGSERADRVQPERRPVPRSNRAEPLQLGPPRRRNPRPRRLPLVDRRVGLGRGVDRHGQVRRNRRRLRSDSERSGPSGLLRRPRGRGAVVGCRGSRLQRISASGRVASGLPPAVGGPPRAPLQGPGVVRERCARHGIVDDRPRRYAGALVRSLASLERADSFTFQSALSLRSSVRTRRAGRPTPAARAGEGR